MRTTIAMAPSVVESAYKYFVMANSQPELNGVEQAVIFTLSVEILLKSLLVQKEDGTDGISAKYLFIKPKSKKKFNAHSLINLYDLLPEELKQYFFDKSDIAVLETYDSYFLNSRYSYERNATPAYCDSIHLLASDLLVKVIKCYQAQNCSDPFIHSFNIDSIDIRGHYSKRGRIRI